MKKFLYLACESGRLIRFDIKTGKHGLIFQDPQKQTLMGLSMDNNKLYFSGKTFCAVSDLSREGFIIDNFKHYRHSYLGRIKKGFWFRLGNKEKSLFYTEPQFHQMLMVGNSIYISATQCNEVWELDKELNLKRKIIINPHLPDFNHINNICFDGKNFYVCLMRYSRRFGYGGYAKFDIEWNEIERKVLGWEAHAFSIIDGQAYNLCASAGAFYDENIFHPHKAGLMVNGELVFEHNPNKYYCKDFSIDKKNIYIVGGEIKKRSERKFANGVIFILSRDFKLIKKHIIPKIGGICGSLLYER